MIETGFILFSHIYTTSTRNQAFTFTTEVGFISFSYYLHWRQCILHDKFFFYFIFFIFLYFHTTSTPIIDGVFYMTKVVILSSLFWYFILLTLETRQDDNKSNI